MTLSNKTVAQASRTRPGASRAMYTKRVTSSPVVPGRKTAKNARQRAHWNLDPHRSKQSVPTEPTVQQVQQGNQKRAADQGGISLTQHSDNIVNVDFLLQPEHRRGGDEQLD